jgi:hypothetical protein
MLSAETEVAGEHDGHEPWLRKGMRFRAGQLKRPKSQADVNFEGKTEVPKLEAGIR